MYTHFTCIIHDTLRSGSEAKPIYMATIQDLVINGIEYMDILEIPETRERGIEPSETTATASKMSVKINNPNLEFSSFLYERMNTNGTLFWNEKIDIYGYVNETEYKLFSGLIEEITSDVYETVYTVTTSDVLTVMKNDVFTRELGDFWEDFAGLKESLVDINTHRLPAGFTAFEKLDEDGETIKYIEYEGHPLDCFLGISQMLFSNPTNSIAVSYLNTNYLDFIDIDSVNALRASLSDTTYGNFKFVWYESIDNPFTFFKEQIFKACVIFPYINNEGKLGLKLHAQPTTSEGVESFDEDKIIEITSKTNSMSKYVNHISIDYNRIISEDEDKFNKNIYSIQPEALLKTGFLSPKTSPLQFQLEGINFGFEDTTKQLTVVQQIIDSYFARYSNSITNITLKSTIEETYNLKVGDYISLSHNHLIDWDGENQGNRGILNTEIEVVDFIANLDEGDPWGGFVSSNRLGRDIEGYTFLNTNSEEITTDFFLGSELSCKSNHEDFIAWAIKQMEE